MNVTFANLTHFGAFDAVRDRWLHRREVIAPNVAEGWAIERFDAMVARCGREVSGERDAYVGGYMAKFAALSAPRG